MRGFDARKEKRNLHFTFVPLELSFFTHAHTVVEERANGKATARRENRLRTKPSFCGRQAQSRAARSEKQPKTRRYAAFGHFTCRATLSDRIESEQRRAAAQRCCQRAGNMLPSHRFARLQLGCLRFFFWFLLSSVCIFGQGFCLHKRPNQIIYNLWENGRLTGLAVNTFEYCECAIEVNCSGFSCPCIGVCGNTFAFLILVLHISVAAAAAIELVQPPRCGI